MQAHKTSKRAVWLIAALAALTIIAAACGDDDDGGTATPTATGDDEVSASATRTPGGTPVNTPAGTTGEEALCEPADIERGVGGLLAFSNEDGVYAPETPVGITLTVQNCSDDSVTLYFATAKRYEIVIEESDSAVVVWNSSDDKAFAEIEGEEPMAVGGTIVYEEAWDQTDSDGEPVDPGTYKISALSVGCTDPGQQNCKFGPVGEIVIE